MPEPQFPLHRSIQARLNDEYIDFYNKHYLYRQPAQDLPLSTSRLDQGIPDLVEPAFIDRVEDLKIERKSSLDPAIPIRLFIPASIPSIDKFPVVFYLHGGGWVFGNIDTENALCIHICHKAACVVITIDYRLAPEHPYPRAFDDCLEVLYWIIQYGSSTIRNCDLDLDKLAIIGASSGGNLAAALTQRVRDMPSLSKIRFCLQVLILPIVDNTALPSNNPTWDENEHAPGLSAEKMLWYRRQYLSSESDWSYVGCSPLLADAEVFKALPPALIVVGEADILRHEGEKYAEKLRANGVRARVHTLYGMPHIFRLSFEAGRVAAEDICASIRNAFDNT